MHSKAFTLSDNCWRELVAVSLAPQPNPPTHTSAGLLGATNPALLISGGEGGREGERASSSSRQQMESDSGHSEKWISSVEWTHCSPHYTSGRSLRIPQLHRTCPVRTKIRTQLRTRMPRKLCTQTKRAVVTSVAEVLANVYRLMEQCLFICWQI